MSVELGYLAFGLFVVVFLVIALGFFIYLIRNYCTRRMKEPKGLSSDQKRPGQADVDGVRTTDDETTLKLPTINQILKQEERSSFAQGKSLNLVPLNLKS